MACSKGSSLEKVFVTWQKVATAHGGDELQLLLFHNDWEQNQRELLVAVGVDELSWVAR